MPDGVITALSAPTTVETNTLNTIDESERRGSPRSLFWPWFGANVSVLGLGYGSYLLGFGVSFWQAMAVGAVGIVASFLFCGFISLAGKRGSAPTMVLSRAAFGVRRPTVHRCGRVVVGAQCCFGGCQIRRTVFASDPQMWALLNSSAGVNYSGQVERNTPDLAPTDRVHRTSRTSRSSRAPRNTRSVSARSASGTMVFSPGRTV